MSCLLKSLTHLLEQCIDSSCYFFLFDNSVGCKVFVRDLRGADDYRASLEKQPYL